MGIDKLINADQSKPYKIFEGRYVDAMPALRADSRVPLTIKQIAKKRLNAIVSENEQLIDRWVEKALCSGDAIIRVLRNGTEYAKVEKKSKALWEIKSNARLVDGGLPVSIGYYKSVPSQEINITNLRIEGLFKGKNITDLRKMGIFTEGFIDAHLEEKHAKSHPIWEELLDDKLEPYAEAVFKQGKGKYGQGGIDPIFGIYSGPDRMMGVFFHRIDLKEDTPLLYALYVEKFNGGRSDLDTGSLDGYSRLVGVRNKKIVKK